MKKVLFAILALLIAAPGAALAQKGKPLEFDPVSTARVTIILPKQGIEETRDGRLMPIAFDANVDFGRAFSTMGYGVIDSQDIQGYGFRWHDQGRGEVQKIKGTTTKAGIIYYGVDAETTDQGDHYAITLRLADKYQYTPFDLARKLYTVESFTPGEALSQLQRPIVHFKTEIDSEYDAESVRANFERLGEPARWNDLMADRFGAKEATAFYSVDSGQPGTLVRYMLDVFPYRNGSKVVISGQIVGTTTSERTVDFRPILASTIERLRAIAAD